MRKWNNLINFNLKQFPAKQIILSKKQLIETYAGFVRSAKRENDESVGFVSLWDLKAQLWRQFYSSWDSQTGKVLVFKIIYLLAGEHNFLQSF